MINFQSVWNYYSRESILKAIVEVAKDREVVSVFRDGRFGKRPNILQYPQDVVQEVAEGTIAFHGSLERWYQPMKLDVGMTRPDLDKLRYAWDVFIDIDVKDFDIAKIAAVQIIEALRDHGVQSHAVKFTGGSSFHIGIPFESIPPKINMLATSQQYPEMLQKIIHFLKWYVNESLQEEILAWATPQEISQRLQKPLQQFSSEQGIDPFKIISMDIFGSRHLFRLPYSLHESSGLVSLPIKPSQVEKFEKEQALSEKVKVEEKFLVPLTHMKDSEALVVEALDWASKHIVEVKEELPRPFEARQLKVINEKYFPPVITKIMQNGLVDGRKRAVFVLITFLRNMGWDVDRIEKTVMEWNEKNVPPLRTAYVRGQLRWHFRQDRMLLPPNCDNALFYEAMGVWTDAKQLLEAGMKNPINYPFRMMRQEQREEVRKGKMRGRKNFRT